VIPCQDPQSAICPTTTIANGGSEPLNMGKAPKGKFPRFCQRRSRLRHVFAYVTPLVELGSKIGLTNVPGSSPASERQDPGRTAEGWSSQSSSHCGLAIPFFLPNDLPRGNAGARRTIQKRRAVPQENPLAALSLLSLVCLPPSLYHEETPLGATVNYPGLKSGA